MNRFFKIACWMTLVLFLGTFAMAQSSSTADLRGTVKDPNGAVVSGAKVTLRDETKNFERSAQSNAEGEYFFTLMPPGMYLMTVEAPGFAKVTAKDIKLTVGQMATLPVSLKLATAT